MRLFPIMFPRLPLYYREATKTLRVGIPRAYFYDDLDEEVHDAVEEALAVILELSCAESFAKIQKSRYPPDRVVQNAESYAIHADDVSRSRSWIRRKQRRIRMGKHFRGRIYSPPPESWTASAAVLRDIFAEVDLLVTPTTRIPAPQSLI